MFVKLPLLLVLCAIVSDVRPEDLLEAPVTIYYQTHDTFSADIFFKNVPVDKDYLYKAYGPEKNDIINQGKLLKSESHEHPKFNQTRFCIASKMYKYYVKLVREGGMDCDPIHYLTIRPFELDNSTENSEEFYPIKARHHNEKRNKTCLEEKRCKITIDFKHECNKDGVDLTDPLGPLVTPSKNYGLYVGVPAAIILVVLASVLALYWLKTRKNKEEEHIYATVNYVSLDLIKPTSVEPRLIEEKSPYAKIIGVIAPRGE